LRPSACGDLRFVKNTLTKLWGGDWAILQSFAEIRCALSGELWRWGQRPRTVDFKGIWAENGDNASGFQGIVAGNAAKFRRISSEFSLEVACGGNDQTPISSYSCYNRIAEISLP
jgi:hypothetical protein